MFMQIFLIYWANFELFVKLFLIYKELAKANIDQKKYVYLYKI
jgi:hypothetical protein